MSNQTTPDLPPVIDLEQLTNHYKTEPSMTHAKWVTWACNCAERVLPIFETTHPEDTRPRDAIAATRAWVVNPSEENRGKADAAAYAAADAATYAARAATYAARAASDAADAASDATYAATYAADAAARAAAYAADAATYAAEKHWQALNLMQVFHSQE